MTQPYSISDLWRSRSKRAWDTALERYWYQIPAKNLALEQALDQLKLERIQQLTPLGWYRFLRDEYFRWKYTAPNRYATTTKTLNECVQSKDGLRELHRTKQELVNIADDDIDVALRTACRIPGLGTAGASGLLALMRPRAFGTVDQFVVKALQQVHGLPEADAVAKMNPDGLTIRNGTVLIEIMRRKAAEVNQKLRSRSWTPRKIDMVLWTYGR